MSWQGSSGGINVPTWADPFGGTQKILNMLGLGNQPYGQEYLSQISGQVGKALGPYMAAGIPAISNLQGQYGQLLSNPSQMLYSFGSGYKQSPGYQWQVDQATKAANQAAAAGGMAGSPEEQESLAKAISGISSQDYQDYLRNVLGLYGQGISGEQGLAQLGAGTSEEYANALANALKSQAGLEYGEEGSRAQGFGSLLGTIGGALL